MRWCLDEWKNKKSCQWVITKKTNDEPIGMFALRMEGFRASFGYVLMQSQWNKGYATEVLRKVVTMAFSRKGISRLYAYCDTQNPASDRVMQKAGLKFEGTLHRNGILPNISLKPRDEFCYAIYK